MKGSSFAFIITCFETIESIIWYSFTIVIAQYFYLPHIWVIFVLPFCLGEQNVVCWTAKFSLLYYNSVISVKLYHCLQVTIWDCFVSSAASYVGWQDYRKSIVLGQFSFYIEQKAVRKLEKKIGFVSLSPIDYRNTMTNLIFMKLK